MKRLIITTFLLVMIFLPSCTQRISIDTDSDVSSASSVSVPSDISQMNLECQTNSNKWTMYYNSEANSLTVKCTDGREYENIMPDISTSKNSVRLFVLDDERYAVIIYPENDFDGIYREEAMVLDLATGKIVISYDSVTKDYLLDSFGKTASNLTRTLEKFIYSICCTVENNQRIYFTLSSESVPVSVSAYYGYNKDNTDAPFDVNIKAEQIIIGDETPAFMEYYKIVAEAMDWFTYGIDAVGYTDEKVYYPDGTQNYYFEVNEVRFTELGIASLGRLKAYLNTIFTEDVTQELLASDIFKEYDGKLCVAAAVASPSYSIRQPEYTLEHISETERILRCSAMYYMFNNKPKLIEFEYHFICINDIWLCSKTSPMCCRLF